MAFWVDEFPNFPFGGISYCSSLEGILKKSALGKTPRIGLIEHPAWYPGLHRATANRMKIQVPFGDDSWKGGRGGWEERDLGGSSQES